MTGSRYVTPYGYAYAPTGQPIPGALLNFYITGSSSLATTYADANLTTPNANPVTADSSGTFPNIFLDPSVTYKVVLSYPTSPPVVVWTADPVIAGTSAGSMAFSQTASYSLGSVGRKLQQFPAIADAPYNADPTGVADASSAITTAAAAGPIWITKGTYLISNNITINSFVYFEAGAVLNIASGKTVTFAGGISADPTQIFSGTGSVAFTNYIPAFGYAEWWGAIPNSSGAAAANLTAINSALIALQKVQLLAEDYWVNGTIIHAVGNHLLAGSGCWYDGVTPDKATRILSTSNSLPILRIGLASFPGTINAMPFGVKAQDIYLNRSVAPLISSNCDGVQMQFCVNSELRNVKSVDSMNSFHFVGVVSSTVIGCQANRVQAGSGAGTDTWNGYWIDGNTNIGAAGGNASLYFIRSQAGCNINSLSTTSANGFYLYSGNYGIQDTFLDHCETVSCYIGTNVAGGGGGQADVHIMHQIDDQVNKFGLYIASLNSTSAVELTDYYCGPSSPAQFAVYVNTCVGAINFKGGQLLMSGFSTIQAINISNSVGVTVNGTIITENNAFVAVGLENASNCRIAPVIHSASHSTTGAGVQLSGTCNANKIEPIVYGQAGAYGFGIQVLGTSDGRNEYNCTGIDSGCISGGAPNKLVRNGTQITAAFTLTGTNTTSGVMT